jgi:hypothetical protein
VALLGHLQRARLLTHLKRIPVNFTIDHAGRLVDDGWKDRRPVWTRERLERIVTPPLEEK